MLKKMTSFGLKIFGVGKAFYLSNVLLSMLTGVNFELTGEVGLVKLRLLLMRILGEIMSFLLLSREIFYGDTFFLDSFGLVLTF